MIKILKEMGNVCENKKVCLSVQDFHRRKFNQYYRWNKDKAQKHQQDFKWWSEKIIEIDKHIEQLHNQLKMSA